MFRVPDNESQTIHPIQQLPGSALNAVVYVRQVDFEGIELFGVFSADGTQVAVAHSRNEAIGWALAKDLETANVH